MSELSSFTNPTCSTVQRLHQRISILSFLPDVHSTSPCDLLQSCHNNATCIDDHRSALGYFCSCSPGFSGTECQFDTRPCHSKTCWNNGNQIEEIIVMIYLFVGICSDTSNTTFTCQCSTGWQDVHCQTKINYCEDNSCLNNGVCQSIFLNYTCHCLADSYSGRHCEITSNRIIILQRVSRSFAYIVIIAMICVAVFVVFLDILKYFFHIDPIGPPRKKRRFRKRKKKPQMVIRYIYVHSPSPITFSQSVEETSV